MENRHERKGASEPETGIQKWLTVPGRLLLIFWILTTVGVFAWWFDTTFEDMPEGMYPLMWWTMPALISGGTGFFVTAKVLERLGARIYRRGQ